MVGFSFIIVVGFLGVRRLLNKLVVLIGLFHQQSYITLKCPLYTLIQTYYYGNQINPNINFGISLFFALIFLLYLGT